MTFTLDTKTLAAGLKPMAKLVKGKITIPVLAGIHVRAGEGIAEFTATDLETAVRFRIEHNTDGLPTETVIADGKGFIKAISGKGEATITIEENRILVACNGAQLAFPTMSAESYPELPQLPNASTMIGVTANQLSRMINQTSYAISQEESRFTLNGALLEVALPRLRMVATDGHRLAMSEAAADSFSSHEFPSKQILIRKQALSIMATWNGNSTVYIGRDLVDVEDPKTGLVEHDVPGPHLFFMFGDTTIISRALTGNFPDYERVLPRPEPNRYTLTVDRLPLLSTLQTAVKYADERSKAVTLRLNGCAKVYTKLNDSPSFTADVPATWTGPEDGEVAYNGDYLVDWLKAQSCDTVLMAFYANEQKTDAKGNPMVDENGDPVIYSRWNNAAVDCYGDPTARTVIMPMRM